jgi:hypothetical protein
MTAGELSKWLQSDESKQAGRHKEAESVGPRSGRRIMALLGRKAADLSDDDYRTCARSSGTSTGTGPSARPVTCGRRSGAPRS